MDPLSVSMIAITGPAFTERPALRTRGKGQSEFVPCVPKSLYLSFDFESLPALTSAIALIADRLGISTFCRAGFSPNSAPTIVFISKSMYVE